MDFLLSFSLIFNFLFPSLAEVPGSASSSLASGPGSKCSVSGISQSLRRLLEVSDSYYSAWNARRERPWKEDGGLYFSSHSITDACYIQWPVGARSVFLGKGHQLSCDDS